MQSHALPALKLFCACACGVLLFVLLPVAWGAVDFVWIIPASVAVAAFYPLRLYNVSYYLGALALGLSIGARAEVGNTLHSSYAAPELRAVTRGTVERILHADSKRVRCIVRGEIDVQALPPMQCGLCLTVFLKGDTTLSLRVGTELGANVRARLPRTAMLEQDFEESRYFRGLDVRWLAFAAARDVHVRGESASLKALAESSAQSLRGSIDKLFPPRSAGLVRALLTGDRSKLDAQVRREFSLTGTAHVLAVSGLHTGIIAVILLTPLGFIRSRSLKWLLFTVALAAYTLITGLQPATLRAACMASMIMLAWCAQREVQVLNVVALAVVLILLCMPDLLHSAGFQMSVAALLGISLFYKPLEQKLRQLLASDTSLVRLLRQSLALSLSVSVTIGPVIAYYFSSYSFISPIANILVVPLVIGGMVISLCAVAFVWLPGLAGLYAVCADCTLALAGSVNTLLASLPWAAVEGGRAFTFSLLFSGVLLYLLLAEERNKLVFRLCVALPFAVAALLLPEPKVQKPLLEFIPRPQLGAVLVRADSGVNVLILQDRRPDQYPLGDYGLERSISALPGRTVVYAHGPAALSVAARLEHKKIIAVIANSLEFKPHRFWQSVDSLQARNVNLVSGRRYWQKDSSLHWRLDNKSFLQWNAYTGECSSRGPDSIHLQLCLPQIQEYRSVY